ncbi:carbohydrate ABC transporter permease [Haladaptatus caseinilyticus]|uniref:carbohydrate ABC transporter permease n=1 Tax=Haladaptatus caseinilyticus TaxID=2993314 RepID=UPI00224B4EAB|nr:carbohydrate ABC transporter permease [Haladaptatus caseinilyticus]
MSTETQIRSIANVLSTYTMATYLVFAVAMVFFLFPVFWVMSMSIRLPGEVLTYPVQLIPQQVTFEPYRQVLQDSSMVTWIFNSLKIAVLEVIGIIVVAVPAAYAFSRFDFRGKKHTLFIILLFQMISPVVIVIPLYNMMAELNLLDTHIGLILLYIGLQVPFSIWLLKSYFDTIPSGLDEAARVDGCNRLQMLIYILLPSMGPGIAVVAIFNFVFSWAEFVMAFTVLGESELYTVSIGLFSFQGQYSTDWRVIAAASVIAMLPLLIMFIGLQRYFVKGLVEGAVKG